MVYKEHNSQTSELVDVRKEVKFSQDFNYDYLIFENYIPFMCLLFDREVLTHSGGFDNSLDIYEDWDLLIRIGTKYPFYHIRQITANYNQWDTELQVSQSNKNYKFIEQSYLRVLSKHIDKFTERRIRNYISHFAAALRDKETAIRDRNIYIKELEAKLLDEDYVRNLETALMKKEAVLHDLYDSHGWKALLVYYRMRDKVLPYESRRRRFARKVFLAVQGSYGLLGTRHNGKARKSSEKNSVSESSLLKNRAEGPSLPLTSTPQADDFRYHESQLLVNTGTFGTPEERDRVLVIDRFLPTYDKDSGSLRMYSFLGILSELGYRITFLPDDLKKIEPYASGLRDMGVELIYGDVDVEAYLKERGRDFAFVILSRPEQTFKYIPLVRAYAANSTIIYDTVDLHWVRFERAASVTGKEEPLLASRHFKQVELFNASCSDITFTITEDERELLLKEIPQLRVEIMPNIHEVMKLNKPFKKRKDIMFIGGFFHQPNEDAVYYFIQEIFPIIKKKVKDMRFFVVGSDPSSAILELNSEDIIVTGYVEDVRPYFENCRVFVSPLRYGAGMKGKIGQSMAYGLPVVTTTIGAEGIGLIDNENALISDDPKGFAEATIRLYTDEKLWYKISKKSVKHIERNYSKKAFSRRIERLFNEIKTKTPNCVYSEHI
jgi:glycosyltransferase involved in cell wall biosynthesis